MATALTRPESGFVIGASCPGCGGDVELSQDFFVTSCRHCGSALRLLVPDAPPAYVARPRINIPQARAALDRYLKEQDRPLTGSSTVSRQILYPYWKIDALTVKVRTVAEEVPDYSDGQEMHPRENERRTVRTVLLAPLSVTVVAGRADTVIPSTIGLRADYLKLRPFESEDIPAGYTAIPVVQNWEVGFGRVQSSTKTLAMLGDDLPFHKHRTDLVSTRASIIYLPYILIDSFGEAPMRAAVDAVSGRVASAGNLQNAGVIEDSAMPSHATLGRIGLELHRCTTCGEDLPTKASLVYCCHNCGKLTLLGGSQGMEIECAPHTTEDILVPFWDCGDLMIPAFRIGNAEAMFRLSRRMTGAKGRMPSDAALGTTCRFASVSVTPGEAAAMVEIIRFRRQLETNERAIFQPGSSNAGKPTRLLFVPFQSQNYFWVDSVLGAVTFERALLR